MIPRAYPVEPLSQRSITTLRVSAQGRENVFNLVRRCSAGEVHRCDLMAVKAMRQVPKQGVLRVGSHALDYEPVPRYAKGDRVPVPE
jgi:hypothetical protein